MGVTEGVPDGQGPPSLRTGTSQSRVWPACAVGAASRVVKRVTVCE